MSNYDFTITQGKNGLVLTPTSQTVTTKDAQLRFQLSGTAASDYKLTGYSSNDSKNQLGSATITGTSLMTVPDANSEPDQINMTVYIESLKGGPGIQLTPIVINEPPN